MTVSKRSTDLRSASKALATLALLLLLGALLPPLGGRAAAAPDAVRVESVLGALAAHPLVDPTARTPVTALRLHRDALMVKVRGPEGLIDEFVFRDAAGHAGVSRGWQLWSHRLVTPDGIPTWFTGTLDLDRQPNADFALRIGNAATPYVSSGDDGPWRGRGFGHGGMRNLAGSNRISLDGGARNLDDVADWPVGTVIAGTMLALSADFTMLLPPDDRREAIALRYVQTVGPTFGLRRQLVFHALVPDVAIQDSPAAMLPLNPGDVSFFQPAGAAPERILSDGRQRPIAYPNPWSQGRAIVQQAWLQARPRLRLTLTLDLGQPLRASDGSIPPWGWNESVRYFFTDNRDYAKYYVMAASSAEDPAARRPRRLVPGLTYETQSSLRTVLIGPNAP